MQQHLGHTFVPVIRHVQGLKKGAAFMAVIEKALGKEITSRTWDTVAKVTRK